MAAVTVAFNGTRVNDADTNTNWANLGGGGPAPAAEPQLVYQGTNAVNRKVTSTGSRTGVQYDPGASPVDMRSVTGTNILFFAKIYVSDFGDLNSTYGVEARIGSSSGDYYDYNVAGSGANRSAFTTYPAQGGYLILSIDPNVAAWREGTTGTPDLQNVDYWGSAAQFVTGGAKSENFAMDAIDTGTGLTLTRGDGVDTDGTFDDFVTSDQNTIANRWGVVIAKAGAIIAIGMLTIGESATATEFTDNSSIILFPDGYHSAGSVGITVNLENVDTSCTIGSTVIGRGSSATEDTRPDFNVVGGSGSLTFDGTLTNHRNVVLTGGVLFNGAQIECEFLEQGSASTVGPAEIENSIIITTSVTSVACLQDPTFGTTTALHDTEFIQGGAGHAIEIDSAGTYDFINLNFTGYGSIGTDSAALDITVVSGTVTINVTGGNTPTYKTAGATVVINNNITITLTGLKENSEIRVYSAGTRTELAGTENATDGTFDDRSFSFSVAASTNLDITIFSIVYNPVYIEDFEAPTSSTSIPISQVLDRSYDNP